MVPYEEDLNIFFTDADGEVLTWDITVTGVNMSWISVSNITDKISGTPSNVLVAYNDSVTVQAKDAFFPNTTIIYYNVLPNWPPYIPVAYQTLIIN